MGSSSSEFDWQIYPEPEQFLKNQVNDLLSKSRFTRDLATMIEVKTSTHFFDWIDHIVVPENTIDYDTLVELQFKENKQNELPPDTRLFHNPNSTFFPLLVHKKDSIQLALKPENIDDFCRIHSRGREIQGEPFSNYRKLEVHRKGNFQLTAVERRGYAGFLMKDQTDITGYLLALELFTSRDRNVGGDSGIKTIEELITGSLEKLQASRVADAFFRAERKYWTKKNRAAQIQKARQDEMGLGWGNHDHHTFRSSRMNFIHLIRIFELMGMVPRESFFAGSQAGWGAQILEQPDCNIVVFADVDMGSGEKQTDFAHDGLDQRDQLGTVGLWVGLHGESILQAGLHHLALKVALKRQEQDLPEHGIPVMAPFSDFMFLKQAFTQGENWKVHDHYAKHLLENRWISQEQYTAFVNTGAIGSHLENIERAQGFKGFNQDSVSIIINKTDPRRQLKKGA